MIGLRRCEPPTAGVAPASQAARDKLPTLRAAINAAPAQLLAVHNGVSLICTFWMQRGESDRHGDKLPLTRISVTSINPK
jgi:hypothetical protein